jgi:hypothetical protein
LATIVASVVGTLIDNIVKGDASRKHNTVLLFNECLAEHHLAYVLFFVALATGATFTKYWGTALLQISLVLALGLYVKGIHSTTKHRVKILADHACDEHCSRGLKVWTVIRICFMNCLFTIAMLGIATYLAVITVHDPVGP